MSYIDIGLLSLTEIIGDFGFKEFANKGGFLPFVTGTTGYIGVMYFLIRSLQGSQVLLVNAAWDGISAIVESIAAIVFLGEHFHDPMRYVGVIFIILGLIFLKIPLRREKHFIFPSFWKKYNK